MDFLAFAEAFCCQHLTQHLPDLIHDVMVELRLTEGVGKNRGSLNGLCKSSGGLSIDFLSAWSRKSDENPTLIQPQ